MTESATALVPQQRPQPSAFELFAPQVPLDVERFVGTMLGVAIGDALGRPAEGRPPHVLRERYGTLDRYRKWRGWRGGPIGTVTGDTQLTMRVARSIVSHQEVRADDLAREFIAWLPEGRGKGRTCTQAVERLTAGHHWTISGLPSAGNGAAMRVAPIGLLRACDPRGSDVMLLSRPSSPTPIPWRL